MIIYYILSIYLSPILAMTLIWAGWRLWTFSPEGLGGAKGEHSLISEDKTVVMINSNKVNSNGSIIF